MGTAIIRAVGTHYTHAFIGGVNYAVPKRHHSMGLTYYIDPFRGAQSPRYGLWALRIPGWARSGWEDITPLTDRRVKNIIKYLPWIRWSAQAAICIRPGWGDKPMYLVPGEVRGWQDIFAYYKQPSPGGSYASLRFYRRTFCIWVTNRAILDRGQGLQKQAEKFFTGKNYVRK